METAINDVTETKPFYVDKIIAEAEDSNRKEVNALAKLQKTKQAALKKLQWETDNLEKRTSEKEKLAKESMENLVDDKRSYEKDKTNLRKNRNEIDACSEAIQILRDTKIPGIEAKITEAKIVLSESLIDYCAKAIAANKVLKNVSDLKFAVSWLQEAFSTASRKICDNLGVPPFFNKSLLQEYLEASETKSSL